MITRWLVVGDLHFKAEDLITCYNTTNEILRIINEQKPEAIVLLGDTLHTHERIHEKALNAAINAIEKMSKFIPVYLLIGNHDRPNNSVFLTDEHPFNALKKWKNVYVIDDVQEFKVRTNNITFEEQLKYVMHNKHLINKDDPEARHTIFLLNEKYEDYLELIYKSGIAYEKLLREELDRLMGIKTYRFIFSPYVFEGRFHEALSRIPDYERSTQVFGHQEIYGVNMGTFSSAKGDIWNSGMPHLITGHIHKFQYIGNNVIYPGTPIQHSFGEDWDKALLLIEFGKEKDMQNSQLPEFKKWVCPWEDYEIRHCRIPINFKKKKLFQVNPDQLLQLNLQEEDLTKDTKIEITGYEHDVIAVTSRPDVKNWLNKVRVKTIITQGYFNEDMTFISQDAKFTKIENNKFSKKLYEACNEDELLIQEFIRIFGNLNQNTL